MSKEKRLQLIAAIKNHENIEPIVTTMTAADKIFVDEMGCNPLHYACSALNEQALTVLLTNGFGDGLSQENHIGATPLHMLCLAEQIHTLTFSERLTMLRFTLEEKPHSQTSTGTDSLTTATTGTPASPTQMLGIILNFYGSKTPPLQSLPAGTTLGILSNSTIQDENVVHLACRHRNQDAEFMTHLLQGVTPAEVMTPNKFRATPLHLACESASIEVVKVLLDFVIKNAVVSRAETTTSTSSSSALFSTAATRHHGRAGADAGASPGAAMVVGGGLFGIGSVVIGALMSVTIVLAPIGIPLAILGGASGGVVAIVGIPVAIVGGVVGGTVGSILEACMGEEFNLLHFGAKSNTADFLRELIKILPAELLVLFSEQSKVGTSTVRTFIETRHSQDPEAYTLTVDEFNSTIKDETCFYKALCYLFEKQGKLSEGSALTPDITSRLNDFCALIKMLMNYFEANKDQEMTDDGLAAHIKAHTSNTEAETLRSIRATSKGVLGTGYGSKDRYIVDYRQRILGANVTRLVRRLDELGHLVTGILNNPQVSVSQRLIARRVHGAFSECGVNLELNPATPPASEKDAACVIC